MLYGPSAYYESSNGSHTDSRFDEFQMEMVTIGLFKKRQCLAALG
jgi:hypothetical protein